MLQGNPMVQNLLSDPQVLRTMFESNPQLRQVGMQAAAVCSNDMGTDTVHAVQRAPKMLLQCHLNTEQPLTSACFASCEARAHAVLAMRVCCWRMLHHMPAPLIATLTARLHLQLMDQHPEVAQLLNNPQQLRDAFAAASNPVSSGGCFFSCAAYFSHIRPKLCRSPAVWQRPLCHSISSSRHASPGDMTYPEQEPEDAACGQLKAALPGRSYPSSTLFLHAARLTGVNKYLQSFMQQHQAGSSQPSKMPGTSPPAVHGPVKGAG